MRAIERLLDDHPEFRGHITLIQILAPSRVNIPEYAQERERYDSLVGRINGKFGEAHWMPILPLHRPYSQQDLAHLYREADACLVTPLRDGMNLVAKEFVASQTSDPGVLVISRFCGAAESMQARSYGQSIRLSADSFRHLPRPDHAQSRAETIAGRHSSRT